MMPLIPPFLNEEEVLFNRMQTFHRRRVEIIESGKSPLGPLTKGVLVIHLIAQSAVASQLPLDGTKLVHAGRLLSAFGDDRRYRISRFNVDGLLLLDTELDPQSWTQILRCGAVEGGSSALTCTMDDSYGPGSQSAFPSPRYLKDHAAEESVFQLVGEYFRMCKMLQIEPPVTMFSSLIGFQGVRIHSRRGFNLSLRSVDRTPAFLPEIKLEQFDSDPTLQMRAWCDTLFQAIGFEKSTNFDDTGAWNAKRR